jgi:hypothetical protein
MSKSPNTNRQLRVPTRDQRRKSPSHRDHLQWCSAWLPTWLQRQSIVCGPLPGERNNGLMLGSLDERSTKIAVVVASSDAVQNIKLQRLFSGDEVAAIRQNRIQLQASNRAPGR